MEGSVLTPTREGIKRVKSTHVRGGKHLLPRNLVEVHCVEVVINEMEGASNELYGHIIADDGIDNFIPLFEADKENAQALSPDGLLSLLGPCRSLRSNSCRIGVRLYEKNLDVEVCNGYLCLEGNSCPIVMDRPITFVIQGDHGYARFHVSVFTFAIEAQVQVVFVPPSGSKLDEYSICGDMSVSYESYFEYRDAGFKKYKSRLFELLKENAMEMSTTLRDNAHIVEIPLRKSVVCTAVETCLCIDTQMWVNDQFFGGTALFYAPVHSDNLGQVTAIEKVQFGKFEVHVNWIAKHIGL